MVSRSRHERAVRCRGTREGSKPADAGNPSRDWIRPGQAKGSRRTAAEQRQANEVQVRKSKQKGRSAGKQARRQAGG